FGISVVRFQNQPVRLAFRSSDFEISRSVWHFGRPISKSAGPFSISVVRFRNRPVDLVLRASDSGIDAPIWCWGFNRRTGLSWWSTRPDSVLLLIQPTEI